MRCALLFTTVVVGGVARLTNSGLSIVEWQPIVGTLPPLSEQAWHEAFQKYQQTPEYQQVDFGMGLAEFKGIFWWDHAHRLLGQAGLPERPGETRITSCRSIAIRPGRH